MSLFDPIELEEHLYLLASHLPSGRALQKAFDAQDNLGKLLLGIAAEFQRFQYLEKKLYDEMDINQTDELISDWETSVGIPDDCLDNSVDIETRRKQVLQKFTKYGGVQTAADFIRVAAFFGFDIAVTPGVAVSTFALSFPIVFIDGQKEASHTIFITILNDESVNSSFILPFPLPFSTGGKQFLQCIFDSLAPANVNVLIVNEGDI